MGTSRDGVWPKTATAHSGVGCLEVIRHLMNHAMMVLFCCIMRSWTGLELGPQYVTQRLCLRDTPVCFLPWITFFFRLGSVGRFIILHTGNRCFEHDQNILDTSLNTNHPVTWPTFVGHDLISIVPFHLHCAVQTHQCRAITTRLFPYQSLIPNGQVGKFSAETTRTDPTPQSRAAIAEVPSRPVTYPQFRSERETTSALSALVGTPCTA